MSHTNNVLIRVLALSALFLLAACLPARAPLALTPTRTARPAPASHTPAAPTRTANEPPAGDRAEVVFVTDGDTITVELDGREYRLRYIGVDSPERDEPFYQAAADFNREMVEGQTVILVRDVSETDQYGRLLRYVYLEDGTFVNGELIADGLARLVTFPPDVAQTEYLRDLQAQARESGAGMWGRPDLTGPCDCDRNLYDCRDFSTQAEAQTCFEYCRESTGEDVHRLDGGGDGRVCESLP